MLSRVKALVFVRKSSTKYNIDFIYHKKGKQTKFILQTKNICLNGFSTSNCFQNQQTYYFFCSQESKFSLIKKLFLSQGTFPQWNNFLTVKELFQKQKSFPQKKKKYLIKEIFYKQESFLQTKTFSDQGSSPQLNILRRSRQFSGNKDQKGLTFLTLKIQKGFTF